jgi:hypothetical protein
VGSPGGDCGLGAVARPVELPLVEGEGAVELRLVEEPPDEFPELAEEPLPLEPLEPACAMAPPVDGSNKNETRVAAVAIFIGDLHLAAWWLNPCRSDSFRDYLACHQAGGSCRAKRVVDRYLAGSVGCHWSLEAAAVGAMTRAGSILIPFAALRQTAPRAIAALRMIDFLPARPHDMPEQARQRQRRADALALLAESSVRSYPSWITELGRKSPGGIDRRYYAYEHIQPGEALELVREPANQTDDHAVAYYHRGVHLGYVPRRQRWIAEALDDGLRLAAIAERVKIGWIFRRARFVGTRIIVLYDGR